MRTSSDESLASATFCEDITKGGCLIQCDVCKRKFEDRTKSIDPSICPHCSTENFYRPWYSW